MFLLLLACSGVSPGDAAPQGDPFVAILSPAEEAVVCGDPLVVDLEVQNFILVEPVEDTGEALPGTGHVDVMLNGQDADMIWDTRSEISGVDDGYWQLKVELSGADHAPVEPYTYDLIYLTVDAAVCG